MSPKQSSTEEQVMSALSARSEATVAELASATSRGRSTVGKTLVDLERSRKAIRIAGIRQGGTRLPDRWRLASKQESSSTNPKPVIRRRGQKAGRLRPGQLDELVIAHMNKHAAEPLGPAAVAKELGRSAGAIANCLARLAAADRLQQVADRPRRYRAAGHANAQARPRERHSRAT
jgi:hypothetical protein